ncbi:MAG: glycoside hydrolase family 9 protein, partial [Polyangiaceae bacterium]|nr:glycoside hydrolase family 9 protein [Polyangiaceae bacterium]
MMPLRKPALSFLALSIAFPMTACIPKGGGGTATPQAATADPGKPAGGNLIKNALFDDGSALPWNSSFTPPANGLARVENGALCLTIQEGGSNNWDAQIRHREMIPQQNHTYNIAFKIWADKPTTVRTKVGMAGPPYREYWSQTTKVTTEPQLVRGGFIMRTPNDPTAEFAIHAGGNMLRDTEVPVTICIDDVYMSDPQYTPPPAAKNRQRSTVRVNQVGYLPTGEKIAAVVSASPESLPWELVQGGNVVASGETTPFGLDSDSGDDIHIIEFTNFSKIGSGYQLKVGGEISPPFNIEPTLYSLMKYDALNYFYQNRSGIPIELPYARNEKLTRPAGHAQSDRAVPCAPDADCSYTLDVSKGWYDAGDHGKYVVNGGVSVWTMLNQYERFKFRGDVSPFEDGKLNIPESGNGVPDILDEARWELEFILGMQVPNGQEKAGMAHHKVHDVAWTALGIPPHEAEQKMKRHLRPVSTAATLNLAATAAQAARIWKDIDPAFAQRCLNAAETAWLAARQYP